MAPPWPNNFRGDSCSSRDVETPTASSSIARALVQEGQGSSHLSPGYADVASGPIGNSLESHCKLPSWQETMTFSRNSVPSRWYTRSGHRLCTGKHARAWIYDSGTNPVLAALDEPKEVKFLPASKQAKRRLQDYLLPRSSQVAVHSRGVAHFLQKTKSWRQTPLR